MVDRSKIGKAARSKGARFERKICKKLTDITNVKFRRAPRSGALIRDGKVNGAYISGDLISEENFKFSIECKNRKNITLDNLLNNLHTSELIKAWHQCFYDADIADKLPIMFFHMITKDYVGLCEHGYNLFNDNDIPFIYIELHSENPFTFEMEKKDITLNLPNIYIIAIKEFEKFDVQRMFIWDADARKKDNQDQKSQ